MTSATLAFDGGARTAGHPIDPTSSIGAPRVMPSLERRLQRVRRHHLRITLLDAAFIAAAASATGLMQQAWAPASQFAVAVGSLVFSLTWVCALIVIGSRQRHQGSGFNTALAPTIHSALIAIAVLAVLAGLTGWPVLRAHLLLTVPAALLALITARLIRRAMRSRAIELAPRTVVIGRRIDVESVIGALTLGAHSVQNIVGVALSDEDRRAVHVAGIDYPVLGASEQVVDIARGLCAETVIAASITADPDYIRRLSWSLEGAATNLVLASHLTDVALSRISFERTSGLALTRVGLPRFDHTAMRTKRLLDVVVATLALIPIGLITPIIALLITIDSKGGVFFRQRRVGRDGQVFDILKFRTMGASAETDLVGLADQNEGSGPLFKLKQDPRVTRVGTVLRRFSLDELPQFWNVLRGEMSVVGPRPPLPTEVRAYEAAVLRRLYVQPGITGLWQISGRSDLTWEQSVRLDLQYVENWSVATDLRIMTRTAAVMVRPKGAY